MLSRLLDSTRAFVSRAALVIAALFSLTWLYNSCSKDWFQWCTSILATLMFGYVLSVRPAIVISTAVSSAKDKAMLIVSCANNVLISDLAISYEFYDGTHAFLYGLRIDDEYGFDLKYLPISKKIQYNSVKRVVVSYKYNMLFVPYSLNGATVFSKRKWLKLIEPVGCIVENVQVYKYI